MSLLFNNSILIFFFLVHELVVCLVHLHHFLCGLTMMTFFRLETGVPARVKPFGVEVRNVKCLRCGNYGHQSGDRECPLRDVIMPNEETRLKRDDPLTAILAHTDTSEVSLFFYCFISYNRLIDC